MTKHDEAVEALRRTLEPLLSKAQIVAGYPEDDDADGWDRELFRAFLAARHDLKSALASLSTARGEEHGKCYECGSTDVIGPICAKCNPELAVLVSNPPAPGEHAALIAEANTLAEAMEKYDAFDSAKYALQLGSTTDGIAARMIRRLADALSKTGA
jgi:hypothetical protein